MFLVTDRCPTEPLICPFPESMFDAWYRPVVMRHGWKAAQDKILDVVEGDVILTVWLDDMGTYNAALTDPLTGSSRSV